MSRTESNQIWKSERGNVDEVPECREDLSEPQYAFLFLEVGRELDKLARDSERAERQSEIGEDTVEFELAPPPSSDIAINEPSATGDSNPP
jgi:hypothetical protein